MTIRELYDRIQGDYEDLTLRLPTEEMMIRFVKRFTTDKTYAELLSAVEGGDISASFEAAHKLKGIAANLAFTKLYEAVGALTEQLRTQSAPADMSLMQAVTDCYLNVLAQYKLFESDGE